MAIQKQTTDLPVFFRWLESSKVCVSAKSDLVATEDDYDAIHDEWTAAEFAYAAAKSDKKRSRNLAELNVLLGDYEAELVRRVFASRAAYDAARRNFQSLEESREMKFGPMANRASQKIRARVEQEYDRSVVAKNHAMAVPNGTE